VDQRVILALRYGEDLAIGDIARLIGRPAGTVKSRLHHGRHALRAVLDAADR
jgi:Sigma-70, region 4.